MKHTYSLLACLLFAGLLGIPQDAHAQDTLLVKATDADGFPVINALRTAINGDTTTTGARANLNRVYKLERGGFYFLTERLTNNGFTLRIVGEAGPTSLNPAVIQKLNREDGSIDDKLLVAQGSVTLKNLIINGRSDQGNLPYEPMRFDGGQARIVVDNVIFEYAQWASMAVYGKNSDVFVTNSTFRNLVSETQKYGGRGMSVWTDADSLYFENNTFFNVGAVPLQVEGGAANHLWFNHNTMVNVGRNLMWGTWWRDAYITNNLIVNGYWHGEDEGDFNSERIGRAGSFYDGMFNVTPLPSQYGLDLDRQIALVANATFREQAFETYYSSTSGDINADLPDYTFGNLRAQPLLNDSTQGYFDQWDNLVFSQHTDGVDPGLVAYGSDNKDEMVSFISAIRAGDAELPLWYWDPGRANEVPLISVNWPLPEDLSYTNATLRTASLGGYPLGNLNWFPTQKAQWEGRQDDLAQGIRDLVNPAGSAAFIATYEAEDAALSNGAATEAPADLLYADLKGGGSIEWTFDLAAAGTHDVVVESRAEFGEKYQRLTVNGVEIKGTTRDEAIHVVDNGADVWFDVVVPAVAFTAGTNTVTITPSWGFSNHRDVKLVSGATTVQSLPIVDATFDTIQLKCDTDLCASGNEYVALGSGSAEWTFGASAGEYLVRMYYSADAATTADVVLNGNVIAANQAFGASTGWTSIDIPGVQFTGTSDKIEVRGTGGLELDYLDLFSISRTTAIGGGNLPEGFALMQNRPNPFQGTTTIDYVLAAPVEVSLGVYDVLGRKVATLADGVQTAGAHTATFSADGLASGLYFFRLDTPAGQQVRTMTVLR